MPQDDDDDDDEKGGLKKELAQKLGKKFEDIDSLRAEVIGKNEEWEELNGYLGEYGSQRFEQHWQSEKKMSIRIRTSSP